MLAGSCEFDISPQKGMLLKGYAQPLRPNIGTHDPLMGCCVYLAQDGLEVAIVTLDLLMISTELSRRIRLYAAGESGLSPENILLCCSHTHSGPRAYQALDGSPETPEENDYMDQLSEKIAQAVAAAKKSRFQAKVGISQCVAGDAEGIGGNRDHKGGLSDPRIGMLGVWDMQDELRCVLVNYALHPTLLHEDNLWASADYPAYIRKSIQDVYSCCCFGFLQGASGDQSSRYYRKSEGFGEAERFGRTIGKAVLSSLQACDLQTEPIFRFGNERLPVELRTFPCRETLERDICLKRAEYQRHLMMSDAMTAHNAKQKMLGAECKLEYALEFEKNRALYEKATAEVWAIRIGEHCISGVMGEYFVEYGLAIKALSGAAITLVVSLTNGSLPGYVCTPAAYLEGGYEPDASMLSETFGASMTQAAIQVCRKLFHP